METESREEYVLRMENLAKRAFDNHRVIAEEVPGVCWKVRRDADMYYWANVFHVGGFVGVGGDIAMVVWPALGGPDPLAFIASSHIDYITKKVIAGSTELYVAAVAKHDLIQGVGYFEEKARKKALGLIEEAAPKEMVWQELQEQIGIVHHPSVFYAREAIRVVTRHLHKQRAVPLLSGE